ncbi:MAG: hypothetical protein SFY81_02715 [Verrucomicrobiota bacterium]|nr:hypothetical protein [Verrucomicrobiota bacterium]
MKKTTSRLLATVQSKGNLGKSTECLARIEWLNRHAIEWQAYDLDDAHRSIFKRYPSQTKLLTISGPESAEQLLRVFRNAGQTPIQIMDARAQATDEILRVIHRSHFLSIAAEKGIRMTVFLFPYDDLATMENLERIVRELGDAVDYAVVRNPAKNQTRMFDGSDLQSILNKWGGVEITMPVLFKSTLLQLDELEARHQRGITWAEAIGNLDLNLDPFARGDLESFLSDVYRQYDPIASQLLPTDAAANIQPESVLAIETKPDFKSRFNFNTD